MSQISANQPLPNGLQISEDQLKPQPLPSSLNKLGSSVPLINSSPNIAQIPAQHLPPRTIIPSSQLPPSQNHNPNTLVENFKKISFNTKSNSETTPSGSPKTVFSTSTPVDVNLKNDRDLKSDHLKSLNSSSAFSPISTFQFKESVPDNFKNVPLNSNNEYNVPKSIQNRPQVNSKSDKISSVSTNMINSQSSVPDSSVHSSNFNYPHPNMQNIPATIPQANFPSVSRNLSQNWTPSSSEQIPRFKNPIMTQAVPFQPPRSTQNQENILKTTENIFSNPSGFKPLTTSAPYNNSMPRTTISNSSISQPQMSPLNYQNSSSFRPQLPTNTSQMPINVSQLPTNIPQIPTNVPQIPTNAPQIPTLDKKFQHSVIPPTSNFPQNFNVSQMQTQNQIQGIKPSRYPSSHNNYPISNSVQSPYPNYPQNVPLNQQNLMNQKQIYSGHSVSQGFNKLWGYDTVDLLQSPNILPGSKIEPPKVTLGQEFLDAANCSPDIFCCTMTKIPDSNSLLQKSRLPFGILIHPFKDLEHLPVIQCSTIVRCRACRTYINPFVFFVDAKRWKCNLCYRLNELPEEFQYDPVSKTYGDPSRRPEIKASTIEYIAPSEYMLRPPQPAVYLFLFDVSRAAVENGYLQSFCSILANNLDALPGDARTQVGFLAYNSALHFYSLGEGFNQPHEMTVIDVDDVFLPCPDNLLINLHERKDLILDLLQQLPNRFTNSYDNDSVLGAALQAAHKLIGATGGRVTVFQAVLPNKGPGALTPREDVNKRSSIEVEHLNPANDFFKRLALECSGQQIAVDLFIVNSQFVDLATISGISQFSGGCIHHFPLFNINHNIDREKFERCLKRYLTRKIGFEAVMRVRCTRGLAIHTFYGNFFVRSTDLLSLPNVNPDAGFGMQIAIEESLSELQTVCFQAALLYTSSKGERRIRVHTLCVPVASTLSEVINSANQQCIVGLLSKMAVDRSLQSSLSDAREAFLNVAIDILNSYKLSMNMDNSVQSGLLAPQCLKLLPLYISALLKYPAFRTGKATRLDDRIKAMCDMKSLPLYLLMLQVYPDLYPVHNLEEHEVAKGLEEKEYIPQPPRLQLSARSLDNNGAYIMDQGDSMLFYICPSVSVDFLADIFGVSDYNSVSENLCDLQVFENPRSQRLNLFINSLNDEKPFPAVLQVIKEKSPNRHLFIERLLEDRVENALSYHEFLQHLKTQVK